jgi:hypothetical protein
VKTTLSKKLPNAFGSITANLKHEKSPFLPRDLHSVGNSGNLGSRIRNQLMREPKTEKSANVSSIKRSMVLEREESSESINAGNARQEQPSQVLDSAQSCPAVNLQDIHKDKFSETAKFQPYTNIPSSPTKDTGNRIEKASTISHEETNSDSYFHSINISEHQKSDPAQSASKKPNRSSSR